MFNPLLTYLAVKRAKDNDLPTKDAMKSILIGSSIAGSNMAASLITTDHLIKREIQKSKKSKQLGDSNQTPPAYITPAKGYSYVDKALLEKIKAFPDSCTTDKEKTELKNKLERVLAQQGGLVSDEVIQKIISEL